MLRRMDRFLHSGGSVHCARCNQLHRPGSELPRFDSSDIVHTHRDTNRLRIHLRRLRQTLLATKGERMQESQTATVS